MSSPYKDTLIRALNLHDDLSLRATLDDALRSVVNDVLMLIYRSKFPKAYPDKKLSEVAMENVEMKRFLSINKKAKQHVLSNSEDQFDITILYQILRHLSGLSKNEEAWSTNDDTLISHIFKIKEVRNSVSHTTTVGTEILCDLWKRVIDSSFAILQFENESEVPKFYAKFKSLLSVEPIIDKVISELLEIYASKDKITLLPILWAGLNFYFHGPVDETYTPTSLLLHDALGSAENISSCDIISNCNTNTIILEGESGTGKTTLLRYLVSQWRPSQSGGKIPMLNSFNLILFLDCNAIKVARPGLITVIKEILPKTCNEYSYDKIMKEITKGHLKVLFLIDGFDERWEYLQDIFKKLQRMFVKAIFIISTRPHCSAKIKSLCLDSVSIATTVGFDQCSARVFIKHIFSISMAEEWESSEFLLWIAKYPDILKIPQLLCWSLFLWRENKRKLLSPTRLRLYKDLTEYMVKKLCHINKHRIMATSFPKQGQMWIENVAEVAYKCLMRQEMSLDVDCDDIKGLIETAKKLKFRDPLEAISTLMQSHSSMTGDGEILVFQFHHETHIEYLVAFYIVKSLENKSETPKSLAKVIKQSSLSEIKILNICKFILDLTRMHEKEMGDVLEPFHFVCDVMEKYLRKDNLQSTLELIACCFNKVFAQILVKKFDEVVQDAPQSPLWIRDKDLQQQESLEIFFAYATPFRIWANIGKLDISLPNSRITKGNANLLLAVLRNAYKDSSLVDLTISHGSFDNLSDFNFNLSWLNLIDCEFQTRVTVPKTLLKLNIQSSSCPFRIDIPGPIECLSFHELSEDLPQIPISVKYIVAHNCAEVPYLCHHKKIEILDFNNCNVGPMPSSAKKITAINIDPNIFKSFSSKNNLASLCLDFSSNSCEEFCLSGEDLLYEILQVVLTFRNLADIKVQGIDASGWAVVDFLSQLTSFCNRCSFQRNLNIYLRMLTSINDFNDEYYRIQSCVNILYHRSNIKLAVKFANQTFGSLTWDD